MTGQCLPFVGFAQERRSNGINSSFAADKTSQVFLILLVSSPWAVVGVVKSSKVSTDGVVVVDRGQLRTVNSVIKLFWGMVSMELPLLWLAFVDPVTNMKRGKQPHRQLCGLWSVVCGLWSVSPGSREQGAGSRMRCQIGGLLAPGGATGSWPAQLSTRIDI